MIDSSLLDSSMFDLPRSRATWGADNFAEVFKYELRTIAVEVLPQYVKSVQGGLMDFSDISVSILSVAESDNSFSIVIGLFYTEFMGGCNCDDDPSPVNSWAKLHIGINRNATTSTIRVCDEGDC